MQTITILWEDAHIDVDFTAEAGWDDTGAEWAEVYVERVRYSGIDVTPILGDATAGIAEAIGDILQGSPRVAPSDWREAA